MGQRKKVISKVDGVCRDCVHVEIVTKHSTLSVLGEPTLGRCPFYTGGKYCVLLLHDSCENYKERNTI